jgi:putative transposase
VRRAEDWRWSSLCRRQFGDERARSLLSEGPVERPPDWLEWVNRPETAEELEALRRSLRRGSPYGSALWQRQVVERYHPPPAAPPAGADVSCAGQRRSHGTCRAS